MVKYRSLEHTIAGVILEGKKPPEKKKPDPKKDDKKAPKKDVEKVEKEPVQDNQPQVEDDPAQQKEAPPQQVAPQPAPVKKVVDPQAKDQDAGDEPVKLGIGNPVDLKPQLDDAKGSEKSNVKEGNTYQKDRDKAAKHIPAEMKEIAREKVWQKLKPKKVVKEGGLPDDKGMADWWKKSSEDFDRLKNQKIKGKLKPKKVVKEGAGWWRSKLSKRGHEMSQDEHLAVMKTHSKIAKDHEDAGNNPPSDLKPKELASYRDGHQKLAMMHHRQAGRSLGWYLKNDTSPKAAHIAYKALTEECGMSEEMINEISRGKLHNYIDKSENDQSMRATSYPNTSKGHGDWKRKYKNRNKGLGRAIDKVNGKAKINATEGTDMSTLSKVKGILEARHSAGGGKKGVGRMTAAGAVNSKGQDNEGDDHIINQLRKATNLRDHKVSFKNKESINVPAHHAKKALEMYSGLRTSQEKAHMSNRFHASHKSFNDTLAGKVAPVAAKRKITLPSTPFDWRK